MTVWWILIENTRLLGQWRKFITHTMAITRISAFLHWFPEFQFPKDWMKRARWHQHGLQDYRIKCLGYLKSELLPRIERTWTFYNGPVFCSDEIYNLYYIGQLSMTFLSSWWRNYLCLIRLFAIQILKR